MSRTLTPVFSNQQLANLTTIIMLLLLPKYRPVIRVSKSFTECFTELDEDGLCTRQGCFDWAYWSLFVRSYANVDELEGSTRDYMYAHFCFDIQIRREKMYAIRITHAR